MSIKILWETESCSRCGGSGEYSYCERFGKVCFKCNGGKLQLSKSGKSMKARYEKNLPKNEISASEIKVGDVLIISRKRRTVVEIEANSGSYTINKDGSKIENISLTLKNSNSSWSMHPEMKMELAPTKAEMVDAINKAKKRSDLGLKLLEIL